MQFLRSVRKFLISEDGPTSVEYCVMLALILIFVFVGLTSTGGGVAGWWTNIDTDLQAHGF